MREMTTNEFANVTVSSLTEPVTVRRYTKTVGTWYPVGTEPGDGQTRVSEVADHAECERRISDLEDEVKRLKQDKATLGRQLEAARTKPELGDLFDLPPQSDPPRVVHPFGQSYAAPKPGAKPKPVQKGRR